MPQLPSRAKGRLGARSVREGKVAVGCGHVTTSYFAVRRSTFIVVAFTTEPLLSSALCYFVLATLYDPFVPSGTELSSRCI